MKAEELWTASICHWPPVSGSKETKWKSVSSSGRKAAVPALLRTAPKTPWDGPESAESQPLPLGLLWCSTSVTDGSSRPSRPREARGACEDEVWLPLLPAALCWLCLKWNQDCGDALASPAEQPAELYHRHPHCSQGLGRRCLAGAAGGETRDDSCSDSGLAQGRGKVWSRSDSGTR
ncbi:protein EOLA2 isoform X4 [Gorilla gorilla gorilla]|uniref:protein EOLA1 isoform X4 n=1 Tax=Gorilla gorilla gorilla TaxID=9595 RepID=UPI0024457EC5|nr:protein EOLA2 isoform X2 [Gorilla gorilla gorilla]